MKKTTAAFLVEVREVAQLLAEMERLFTSWFVGRSTSGLSKSSDHRKHPGKRATESNPKEMKWKSSKKNITVQGLVLYH